MKRFAGFIIVTGLVVSGTWAWMNQGDVSATSSDAHVIELGQVETSPNHTMLDIVEELPAPITPAEGRSEQEIRKVQPQNDAEVKINRMIQAEKKVLAQLVEIDEQLNKGQLNQSERATMQNQRQQLWDLWLQKKEATKQTMEKLGYLEDHQH